MGLEADLKQFCDSYNSFLSKLKSEELSIDKLEQLRNQVIVPNNWGILYLGEFWEAYNQEEKLRSEDSQGEGGDIGLIRQLKKSDERIKWRKEVMDHMGLIMIGDSPTHLKYVISYISIPLDNYNLMFIPGYSHTELTFYFKEPLQRELVSASGLFYEEESEFGRLWADFQCDELNGDYKSKERLQADQDSLNVRFSDPWIKIQYTPIKGTKPGVKTAKLKYEDLGKGEIESFLKHIRFITE